MNCQDCNIDKDINRLSVFLMKNYPDNVEEGKSAVDIVIELLEDGENV